MPSRISANAAITPGPHDDDHRDDGETGRELAVDDVVAVDRLRQEPRQRAVRPLAVDRVERERETEQRPDERQEPDHGRQRDLVVDRRCQPEQRDEERGEAGGSGRRVTDLAADEVERDGRSHGHDDREDQEPRRQDVVAELLRGDDHPAGARDRTRPRRRRRVLGGRSDRRVDRLRSSMSFRHLPSRRAASLHPGSAGSSHGAAIDILERRHDGPDRRQRQVLRRDGCQHPGTDGCGIRTLLDLKMPRIAGPGTAGDGRDTADRAQDRPGARLLGVTMEVEARPRGSACPRRTARRAGPSSLARSADRRRRCRSGRRPTGPG